MGRHHRHTPNRFIDRNPSIRPEETIHSLLLNNPTVGNRKTDLYFDLVIPITGYDPGNILLHVHNRRLYVEARHEEQGPTDDNGYLRHQVAINTFERSYELGELADPDNITVRFEGNDMILRLYHR